MKKLKKKSLVKKIILLMFLHFFDKELDNVEPEVDLFFAGLTKPYID